MGLRLSAADSLIVKLDVSSSYLTSDNLFNVYFINEKLEIIQYNYQDSTQRSYSNKQLGRPTLIDASNALKILVFYGDYNTVVLLDNKLSELAIIKLSNNFNKTNYQPVAICKESESDFIWMYDDLSRKLIQFDETGTVITQSEPFDQLFDFAVLNPKLFSVNNTIYLFSASAGLMVFDNYANYMKSSTQYATAPDQITEDFYLFTSLNVIELFNIKSTSTSFFITPVQDCLQANIVGDKLLLRTQNFISIYKMNKG